MHQSELNCIGTSHMLQGISKASAMAHCLQVQNLFKDYQVKDKVFKAVQDATLDFPANQIIALLGPSGSGKTTLLRLIAGLESVTQGQIFFGGKHHLLPEPRPNNCLQVCLLCQCTSVHALLQVHPPGNNPCYCPQKSCISLVSDTQSLTAVWPH